MAIDGQEDSFAKESEELPDSVIIALLKREHLLTRAKLNALYYEHITGERKLRSLKTQLRQVELPTSPGRVHSNCAMLHCCVCSVFATLRCEKG